MTPEIRARIGRPGAENPNYRGGWVGDNGRVRIGKRLRYHIVWDEGHPDDPVQPGEVIHHLNHDHTDDRLENLVKLASQSEHMRHHQGMAAGRQRDPLGRFV